MRDTPQVTGAAKLVKRIQRARSETSALVTDPEIGRLLIHRVRGRFEKGVSPDGNKWDALAESTVISKKKKGYRFPKKPLQATGRLYDALRIIQGSSAGLFAGNTGSGFRIGVNSPEASVYGRIHNYGYGQKVRKFIGLSKLDVESVQGLLRRKLKLIAKAR